MRYHFGAVLLLVTVVSLGTAQQRPSTASICDYYAMQRFGANSSDTQFKLMEHIVALAFGGGVNLRNASDDSTGILNPGSFSGLAVNLRSWFDGSSMFDVDFPLIASIVSIVLITRPVEATTNLNNQAVGINWLDDGAQAPLMSFLNGTTSNVELEVTSNE